MGEPVAFGVEHLEHLATARQYGIERAGRIIGERPWVGMHPLGKKGEGVGIDTVGLRDLACRTREVADLTWVGNHQRHRRCSQGGDDGA